MELEIKDNKIGVNVKSTENLWPSFLRDYDFKLEIIKYSLFQTCGPYQPKRKPNVIGDPNFKAGDRFVGSYGYLMEKEELLGHLVYLIEEFGKKRGKELFCKELEELRKKIEEYSKSK